MQHFRSASQQHSTKANADKNLFRTCFALLFLCRSSPQLPVQRAILNRLRNVITQNVFGTGEVGDGAGHLEDAVVSPRAQVQIGHRELEQFRRHVQDAIATDAAASR